MKELTFETKDTAKYEARCKLAVKFITEHPEIIPLLKDKYTTDDILEEALQLEPDIFKYIKNPSQRIMCVAFDIDGGNMKYVPKHRLATLPEETLMVALDSNFDAAMPCIDVSELSDDAQMDIFTKDPVRALEYGIKVPEYYIMAEIRKTPNIIRYIPNATEEMKCEALNLEPNVALYFDELTDKMMDIIDEKYPYLAGALPNYTRIHEKLGDENNGDTNQRKD